MVEGVFGRFGSIEELNSIPKGDMPGDKININNSHLTRAKVIIPVLLNMLNPIIDNHPHNRAVISVCGGSGTGKSEIASLLSFYLNQTGTGSYTLSGDNYPHRIPEYNDAERLRIFRQSGIRGLIGHGQYSREKAEILNSLQSSNEDADPKHIRNYPWLELYQSEGRRGLRHYLGTPGEINFAELNSIISQFKNGSEKIFLKRMGRKPEELWYEEVDFKDIKVMVIEWTHGNSYYLKGVDIPVLLSSTPQETLEFRKKRNRDTGTDSPFTEMVLNIEQELLTAQAPQAKIIVSLSGEIISYKDYINTVVLGGL
ncbi:MAG: adenylylsulfate kinase [Clostridiaceae bacterium]|jgi:alpha-galactosidase|nr:adenylylsulfate kinase [Clostridiaceae bacterium]